MCVSFDASVLLWKVKTDLNLTVLLCSFVYKGGHFIVLKKKKSTLHGLSSLLFYKPLSKLATLIYFSHLEMCINGSQVYTAPRAVGEVWYQALD